MRLIQICIVAIATKAQKQAEIRSHRTTRTLCGERTKNIAARVIIIDLSLNKILKVGK